LRRRASFLIGRLEEQLFDSAVRIVDDPLRPWVPFATVRWRRFADRHVMWCMWAHHRLADGMRVGAAIGPDDGPRRTRGQRGAGRRAGQPASGGGQPVSGRTDRGYRGWRLCDRVDRARRQ
jgi:hypothetical protein